MERYVYEVIEPFGTMGSADIGVNIQSYIYCHFFLAFIFAQDCTLACHLLTGCQFSYLINGPPRCYLGNFGTSTSVIDSPANSSHVVYIEVVKRKQNI